MCLYLENTQAFIAKEDIKVYKIVKTYEQLHITPSHSRKSFTAKIRLMNESVVEVTGALYYDKVEGNAFLCHNDIRVNGAKSPNRLGYQYSYYIDDRVIELHMEEKIPFVAVYKTPYQEAEVVIGQAYYSALERKGYIVDRGLHSFPDLEEAKAFQKLYQEAKAFQKLYQKGQSFDTNVILLVECIIPEGAKYYTGTFSPHIGTFQSYASDTLIYKKILVVDPN